MKLHMRMCIQGPLVRDLLLTSTYFNRSYGHDHLLIVGMNYAMDFYILKPECKHVLQTCHNCTKLAIDDYSFLCPDNGCAESKGDFW